MNDWLDFEQEKQEFHLGTNDPDPDVDVDTETFKIRLDPEEGLTLAESQNARLIVYGDYALLYEILLGIVVGTGAEIKSVTKEF